MRERKEDIPLLVLAFVQDLSSRMGKHVLKVPPRVMEALERHDWPGNIRELRNVIERGVILSAGDTLQLAPLGESEQLTREPATLAEAQHQHILKTLERTAWRIKGPHGAAQLLGLKPGTLYSRMRKLGIPHRHERDENPTQGWCMPSGQQSVKNEDEKWPAKGELKAMSNATGKPGGWKQRIRHELFEYWMTVLYLALYFGAFTMYRRLILAEYQISYMNYGMALIEALVLAKVILLGDLLRLGRGLENWPLIIPTLFRAIKFTIWVGVFTILEHTIRGGLRGEGLAGGFGNFISKGKYELLASSLVVFFTFIPFFAFRELNRLLGKGRIWEAFFRGGPARSHRLPQRLRWRLSRIESGQAGAVRDHISRKGRDIVPASFSS